MHNKPKAIYKDGAVFVDGKAVTGSQLLTVLSQMKAQQVNHYTYAPGSPNDKANDYYADIIAGKTYELTSEVMPQSDFYRVLHLNSDRHVTKQDVIYVAPVTILSLP